MSTGRTHPPATAPSSKPPQWHALQQALQRLCEGAAAANVFVRDAWGNRWCSARPFRPGEGVLVDAATAAVVAACDPPLARGGKVDVAIEIGATHGLAISYAGVYVLVVQYELTVSHDGTAKRHAFVRRKALAALSNIEVRTVGLPPPSGPGTGGAQAVGTP
jgi:hypothetical protein